MVPPTRKYIITIDLPLLTILPPETELHIAFVIDEGNPMGILRVTTIREVNCLPISWILKVYPKRNSVSWKNKDKVC